MENVFDVLKERGFLDAITSEDLQEHLKKPRKIYLGFDPTADSLHVGSLVGIMVLKWLQKFGHRPIVMLGGGTGYIGDPSGKSQERPLLQDHIIKENVLSIKKLVSQILDFSDPKIAPEFYNNHDWFSDFTVLDFLRDVGKHFRIGPMLAKENVKKRLHSSEGLSFTEFSYSLLQGYDFYKLFTDYSVDIQIGGSDQWGNIVSGLDLIRKKTDKQAFGMTYPLLTKPDGTKYGKTEQGTIWLSEEKLSVYAFYQFFIRIPDEEVIRLMKMLTFLDLEEIASYESNLKTHPQAAQKALAKEVTTIVHGQEKMEQALKASQLAHPGKIDTLDEKTLEALEDHLPLKQVSVDAFEGVKFLDFVINVDIAQSKSQIRRLIENKGLYLNETLLDDFHYVLSKKDLIGPYLLFSLGKKTKILVKVTKK